jgi:hypothetical protein
MTPTQRSLKHLRDNGYRAEVVERFNSFTKRRHDLFGIADIVAIRENEVLLVQTTSGSNVAARVTKIAESEATPDIRKAGMGIIVHGWRKSARNRWVLREVDCS